MSIAAINSLPPDLPVPVDDGATDHLRGMRVPPAVLRSTDGGEVALAALPGRTIVYVFPRTGAPDEPVPSDWNAIPGARGCTPMSCSFRDKHRALTELGAAVFGLSTQDTAFQTELAQRLHLPYPLLTDEHFELTRALDLPTFDYEGTTLLKRMTLVLRDGVIEHVFYPVFPPDRSADQVIEWLHGRSRERA